MTAKFFQLPTQGGIQAIVDTSGHTHPWYMAGTASIDPSGSITTTTRLESHVALSGFTGGMVVGFLNSAGEAVYTTPLMQYGVDGRSVFWSPARSPRDVSDHFQVDPSVYNQTDRIAILLFHAPKNRAGAIIGTLLATVAKIIDWIASQQDSDSSTIVSSTSSALSTPPPSSEIHSGEKYAIHAPSGNYLTAVNGGGMGEPAGKLPLHTDATQIGPWEKFKFISLGGGAYAIQTVNGHYLTAVNAGGMGGQWPLNTDARQLGPWEVFTIDSAGTDYYTIKTVSGNYVTAVNGGGMVGDPSNTPLHTDATRIATWEKFALSNPRGSR